MDIRRQAMSIVLSMMSSQNVEEVVIFYKKQLQNTQEVDCDKVSFLGSLRTTRFINHSYGSGPRNTGGC
jgi:hypothetical protein